MVFKRSYNVVFVGGIEFWVKIPASGPQFTRAAAQLMIMYWVPGIHFGIPASRKMASIRYTYWLSTAEVIGTVNR